MSELLYDWLNKKVRMLPKIEEIRKDFSTGYRFGELLNKLALISNSDFNKKYKESNDYLTIRNNYINFTKDIKEKLGIEITDNMINEYVNQNLTSSANLLYKIKVTLRNKKINFEQIRTFDINDDIESIKKKFSEIASFGLNTLSEDFERENILSDNERYNETNPLIIQTKKKKIRFADQENDNNINIEDYNIKKTKNRNSMTELPDENFEDIKKKIHNRTNSENQIENVNILKMLDNKNSENYQKHRRQISDILSTNTTFKTSVYEDTNKPIKELFNYRFFGGNLYKMGFVIDMDQLKFLNGTINHDMTQDTIMKKVKEQLKGRIEKKKKENIIKQEQTKKDLEKKLFFSPSQKPIIDFRNTKIDLLDMNKHTQVKNLKSSLSTRIKFDKNLKEKTRKSRVEKRLNLFRSYIQKSIEKQEEEKILKSQNTFIPLLYEKEIPFNKHNFILSLNKISLEKSLKISKEHKENLLIDTPLMRSISYQIIDMAFEGYLYQKDNEKDLLDLPIFKDWNYKFVNGIPIRPPLIDDDDVGLYRHIIGKGKFNWTIDNEREIFDYLNYAGEWDYTYIIPKNVLGKSIDFKDIYINLSDDFEPTKIQIEDVEIPNKSIKNVKFSELISNVLENIFPDDYDDNDNSSKEKGKWDYIPYKISLIGYPLSGRKTQANILKSKYPNLNIYSLYDIIKEKSNEWENINEPIENHPKFKTMKPNQIESLKEEQNKKIEEFKINNQIIISYLENKDKNKTPNDELLLKLLIDKIEKDFIEKSEEGKIEEMVKKQRTLKELKKKLEELKIENETAKKPNLKEEQNIQNEIDNIINESFKGFILTDFPRTISQCILLENYLTGYIDPTSKPKSQKDFVFDSLANILDIEYKPKTNNTIKKGGLDFIINLNVKENIINERLKDSKYDPLTGKIYNESEINVNGKINIDKKIYERLVNEIPEFSNNKFELMKNEYNDNCSKIDRFYSNFGFIYEKIENTYHKSKETIHLFQNIEIGEKEEISNFINEKLLKTLYKEKDRKERITYLNLKKEDDEERDFFHLDSIRLKTQTTLAYKKESALILDASEYIYNKVMNFTQKYKEVLKKFIIFFDEQYEVLCKRYDKVQRRFDKFLALGTDKKKLIKVYVNKYNDFIRRFSQLANHQYVYDEFRNDVEELNNKLWLYVRQKQSECIIELNEIFSIKFCENEIKKFYLNVIELFKIECEKFITCFNIILKVYGNKKNEEQEKPIDFNIILEKTKPPSIFDDMDKYSKNINTIYINCIKFILNQEERCKNLENYMKSLNALNDSNTTKHHKRTLLNASLNTTHIKLEPAITYEEGVLENIRKEKLKFKFRITVLKHFSLDYLERIFYTTQRVHNNMDSWIMMGVRLQNIALTKVKTLLLKYIDEGKEIPENAFDSIEMDHFDKELQCYDQINYEHILGSRKRESHIHLDFTYDITCLEMAYREMKKFEIENNIMSKYIFKEIFIKGIVFNRSDPTEKPINAGICYPLKYLSYKEIMRLVDKFKVTFEHYNKKETNKNEVYEDYIDIGGIFTIICVIGSNVLSRKDKANIENYFKDKMIKGKYISKEDFKNYHFWFEDDEYLHKKEHQISVKDLLFEIWKDEKGENMDLKSFIYSLSNEKHGGKKKDNILKIDYYNYALY